jgi:hypothetical protein
MGKSKLGLVQLGIIHTNSELSMIKKKTPNVTFLSLSSADFPILMRVGFAAEAASSDWFSPCFLAEIVRDILGFRLQTRGSDQHWD